MPNTVNRAQIDSINYSQLELFHSLAPRYDSTMAQKNPNESITKMPYLTGTTVYRAADTGSQKAKLSLSALPCKIWALNAP